MKFVWFCHRNSLEIEVTLDNTFMQFETTANTFKIYTRNQFQFPKNLIFP